MNSHILSETLEHRILHGLSLEWEQAWLSLSPSYAHLIEKPLFGLRDMKRRLGEWSPQRREISISRHLALNYPWGVLREVLLHETAHQLADALAGSQDEPAHGTKFRLACNLLGASPEGSANYELLSNRPDTSLSDDDKILLRIQKLMALSKSSNLHEAQAAMAKAHQLIAKYNIDLLSKDFERQFTSVVLGKPALRQSKESYLLAGLLQEFYFVSGIWVSAYVIEKGKMGRVLEISGTPRNLKTAVYAYECIQRFIARQWAAYKPNRPTRRQRSDFAVGVIQGFKNKLVAELQTEIPSESRALIKAGDPRLKRYFKTKYRKTRSYTRSMNPRNPGVYRDGIKLGETLVIHEGIEENPQGNPKRISEDSRAPN